MHGCSVGPFLACLPRINAAAYLVISLSLSLPLSRSSRGNKTGRVNATNASRKRSTRPTTAIHNYPEHAPHITRSTPKLPQDQVREPSTSESFVLSAAASCFRTSPIHATLGFDGWSMGCSHWAGRMLIPKVRDDILEKARFSLVDRPKHPGLRQEPRERLLI